MSSAGCQAVVVVGRTVTATNVAVSEIGVRRRQGLK
jgi:hypothetical protein